MLTRKLLTSCTTLLSALALAGASHAVLVDNGDGTITQIRSDGSELMWLQDANYAYTSGYSTRALDWFGVLEFIDYLNANNHLGYDDWRVPGTAPVNGQGYDFNIAYDGSTDVGYNIRSPASELGYMYYQELGNIGYYDEDGNEYQPGWGLTNTGPFLNLYAVAFWSSTIDADQAFIFGFGWGDQSYFRKIGGGRAWPVRTVDAPEPGLLVSLASGLLLLLALDRRVRSRA